MGPTGAIDEGGMGAARGAGVRKVEDVVVFADDTYHCGFPSVVRRPDGELLLAFRRAPDRRRFGATGYTHTDANAQLVLTRSRDGGRTWAPPALLHAHPLAGLQDPSLVAFDDGSILCATYGWMWLPPASAPGADRLFRAGDFAFVGGLLLRSDDTGISWHSTIPPSIPGESRLDPFGRPVPAYNRGAMCQTRDGRLLWAVAAPAGVDPQHTAVHLLTSPDRGSTWAHAGLVAADDRVLFNEASLYETSAGDIVAFLRTGHLDDNTAVARSKDGGRTFGPWQNAGFRGHPHHVARLPDGRALLVYGYRHAPFGIRARVLDAECLDVGSAAEFVLRDDGGSRDLGYPWVTMVDDDSALVAYYFNNADGPRYIAATVVEVDAGAPARGVEVSGRAIAYFKGEPSNDRVGKLPCR